MTPFGVTLGRTIGSEHFVKMCNDESRRVKSEALVLSKKLSLRSNHLISAFSIFFPIVGR